MLLAYFAMSWKTKALFCKLGGCMHPLRHGEVVEIVHKGSLVQLKRHIEASTHERKLIALPSIRYIPGLLELLCVAATWLLRLGARQV